MTGSPPQTRRIGTPAMIRHRLVVTGRVQGVGYRAWFVRQATALGLHGWVRNCAEGSVEAVVQGAAETIDAIVARARTGPPAARVAEVAVHDDASDEALCGFAQRPTA